MNKYVHILFDTCGVKKATTQHQIVTDLSPHVGVLDVSATRQMHSKYPMLAIAEDSGHSPSLAEEGGWHHLPGLGDLEDTSFPQGLTACIQNKHK